MEPVNGTHVSEPGLVVVDVAVADDATTLGFRQLLSDRWATATAERTTRDVGRPPPWPARGIGQWGRFAADGARVRPANASRPSRWPARHAARRSPDAPRRSRTR
ncbi:DUF6207 family protein [Streptomyces sp. NPDC054783]